MGLKPGLDPGVCRHHPGTAREVAPPVDEHHCTGLAGAAAREGRAERAERLFGAAEALGERTGAGVSWSVLRGLNERDLATARESLDPEVFERAWADGRAMTPEETVAYAQSEAGVSGAPRS